MSKLKSYDKTTIYIENIDAVKHHMININEKSFRSYINRLIKDDIYKNGDEYVIKKYFKE